MSNCPVGTVLTDKVSKCLTLKEVHSSYDGVKFPKRDAIHVPILMVRLYGSVFSGDPVCLAKGKDLQAFVEWSDNADNRRKMFPCQFDEDFDKLVLPDLPVVVPYCGDGMIGPDIHYFDTVGDGTFKLKDYYSRVDVLGIIDPMFAITQIGQYEDRSEAIGTGEVVYVFIRPDVVTELEHVWDSPELRRQESLVGEEGRQRRESMRTEMGLWASEHGMGFDMLINCMDLFEDAWV